MLLTKRWNITVAALAAFLVSGLSLAQTPNTTNLPATFIGTLPCADCPAIIYQINLLIDHTFVSRMTYEERNSTFDEQGSWDVAGDGKVLVLKPAHGRPQNFSLPDPDTLRQLDADGHEIQSKFNYDLKRAVRFAPLEDQRSNSDR